jgi:Spy/CpxP family protein refolding chaperone
MKKCRQARAAKKMGLTEDQQKKLKALGEKYGPQQKQLGEERRKLVKDLAQKVKTQAKDADFQATLDALAKNRGSAEALRDKREKESRAILTPAQQAKFVLRMVRQAMGGKQQMRRPGRKDMRRGGPGMRRSRPGMRGEGFGEGFGKGSRSAAVPPMGEEDPDEDL